MSRSRYLRRVKPTAPGTVTGVGPGPEAPRLHLDHATWHARLAGWSGPIASADPSTIARFDPEHAPIFVGPLADRAA